MTSVERPQAKSAVAKEIYLERGKISDDEMLAILKGRGITLATSTLANIRGELGNRLKPPKSPKELGTYGSYVLAPLPPLPASENGSPVETPPKPSQEQLPMLKQASDVFQRVDELADSLGGLDVLIQWA